ncbi:hypothetical protein [Saccharothrix texasensis]|uniref:Uncharacterized protein n=1 Tax=Saccharothrix texasensis TaxID=103734 RepID=A0A3N1H475_9PSEU|nr:hypothetical protein [Saccharothrix texasensis]ROP37324.1 hypothetical protein EDD40_2629 [Saccharothrix texasensis]
MPSTTPSAALPDLVGADRLLFGDDAARWLHGPAEELLPAQARPAAVRRTWLLLAVVLLALAGIAAAIGTVL